MLSGIRRDESETFILKFDLTTSAISVYRIRYHEQG